MIVGNRQGRMRMKKVKLILWLLIIAALGFVVYQNREFFLAKQALRADIFGTVYAAPELPVAMIFIGFFFIGWFIAYLFNLGERFADSKRIKSLQQTIYSQRGAIDAVKKDIEALKPQAVPAQGDAAAKQP
jgi:hypothetical protein